MQVGAIGAGVYSPYIYNTNSISRASLNKIQGIGDDLQAGKTDFSEMSEEPAQTTNPLRPGETRNFVDILEMQMQMGRNNAARVMVNPTEPMV